MINKFAVVQLPAPTFLLLAQLLFSALAVQAAHWAGALKLKRATSAELMHFVPVVAGFVGTIYANMKVLQYANVETFITFRCSTPLVLAFFDWALLGRQLPSARSWGALLALLLSAAGYTFFDKGFQLTAYFWCAGGAGRGGEGGCLHYSVCFEGRRCSAAAIKEVEGQKAARPL